MHNAYLEGWWSIFGFVGKHQHFNSIVGSYRKPVEEMVQ